MPLPSPATCHCWSPPQRWEVKLHSVRKGSYKLPLSLSVYINRELTLSPLAPQQKGAQRNSSHALEAFTSPPEVKFGLRLLNPQQHLNQGKNYLTYSTQENLWSQQLGEKYLCWYMEKFNSESQ